ncbi:MAG: cytochrome c, partial [Gammaproteobacteria bacterium]|nr:cytochrome c [Gammaproteobacteria bacterium]
MAKKQPLKSGEKILFIVFGVFFLLAVVAYIALESFRLNSDKPVFVQNTFFDFSPVGKEGSQIYQQARCNSCHRALRMGTSMGLILDGIGSRRTVDWLESFLVNPEKTYGAPTLDHGLAPKEAAYVNDISRADLRKIAVFLSELRADAGSSVAKVPPPERSE